MERLGLPLTENVIMHVLYSKNNIDRKDKLSLIFSCSLEMEGIDIVQ